MPDLKTLLAPTKDIAISATNLPANIRAASVPQVIHDGPEGSEIKQQTSAPSYLFSLKCSDAPPFQLPGKEAKPKILIDTIMCVNEVIEMIAAGEADDKKGLTQFLGKFLIKKNIVQNFATFEKNFLIELVREVINYAAQRDFSSHKLAVMITIYLDTHLYFKWYYWMPPTAIWSYFKELMIKHTVEDSPDGEEVFEPDECYDIMTHFHTVYLSNLPLIHIRTFGVHRLKLTWPFKVGKG